MSEQKKIVLHNHPSPSEIKDALKTLEKDIKEQKALRKVYPEQVNRARGGRRRLYPSKMAKDRAAYQRRKASR